MTSRPFSTSLIYFFLLLVAAGCKTDAPLSDAILPEGTLRLGKPTYCEAFNYADSLFYYKEQQGGNFEKPLQNLVGTFGAFPAGLAINTGTGIIDINNSESGLTYRVWFVPKGTTDTCSRLVTVSGINYRSRLYRLSVGDSLAAPFYNGASNQACPCTNAQKGCAFNQNPDALMAVVQGQNVQPVEVEMDKETGVINLAKTIRNGLFGKKPVNGSVVQFRLFYRLNDASKKALNYLDVRIHYYENVRAIPAGLLARINYKNTANFRIATLSAPRTGNQATSVYDGDSDESLVVRPPEVVVTDN